MNFELTASQRHTRERFEQYFVEHVAPHAAEIDRTGVVPSQVWDRVVDSGYLRLFHSPEDGGFGADPISTALAMEALARACGGTFCLATVSGLLFLKALLAFGAKRHVHAWLGPTLRGETIGVFAVAEEGAASDPGTVLTTLRRDERGKLRLRGRKMRVTNATNGHVAIVITRGESGGFAAVVVDLNVPGVSRAPIDCIGLRGAPWGVIAFEDVEVADDAVATVTFERMIQCFEWGMLYLSIASLGFAEAALDSSIRFASRRASYGRPLTHLPVIHRKIADMKADLDAARLLAWRAAHAKAIGAAGPTVLLSKAYCTEMAVRVSQLALEVHGSWGASTRHPLERIYRDSIMALHGAMANDRIRDVVASQMLGVSPFEYDAFDWLTAAGLGREPLPF